MPTRDEVIAELTASGPFELTTDESLGWPIRVFKNAMPSMRAMLEASRVHGDRPFLIYEDEVITFEQHFRRAAALAAKLRELGVGKGDRVGIGMRNYPEWPIAFWACQAIGA